MNFDVWDEIPDAVYDLIDKNIAAFGIHTRIDYMYIRLFDVSIPFKRVDVGHVFLHVDSQWIGRAEVDYPTSLGLYSDARKTQSIIWQYVWEMIKDLA